MLRTGVWILATLFIVASVSVCATMGGGRRLEDRTRDPELGSSALEVVADLDLPPGNVAVSSTGRVFFTYHPEGGPDVKVAEVVDGKPRPYPNEEFRGNGTPHFQTPLSLRIDRQDRLWVLDYGRYGFGEPKLLAFDLKTSEVVHRYDFPSAIAGWLSMLNDFQVDPEGRKIYMADSSLFGRKPAVIVYDVETKSARRLLEGDTSVVAKSFLMNAAGREMVLLGLIPLKIGIDSIALDKQGEWLYYAPVSDDRMYRIAVRDLNDESLSSRTLASKVESFGPKTLSDGLSMDLGGNVYITDMEHSAILSLGQDRTLRTLLKDPRLRWPDGLSFGPDGWLYVSCSALHQVILRSAKHVRSHAPYQIFRFKPGPAGVPGQ